MLLNEHIRITELTVMQYMLKKLMQEIHEICETNGIVYNLFGGSLLGAVRHQDIIPWDDDIDITMPRPDYERFKDIVLEKYADKYDLYVYPKKGYIYPFMKLCRKNTLLFEDVLAEKYRALGLYVDIFPMDGVPEMEDAMLTRRYEYVEKNRKCVSVCTQRITMSHVWWKKPFIIVRMIRTLPLRLLGYRRFLKNQISEMTRYAYDDYENVGFVSHWGWGKKGIIKKSDYLNRKLYKFGDYEFWGPQDYDTNLSKWYGDYMTPPPENKRVPCHNYRLYVKKDFE